MFDERYAALRAAQTAKATKARRSTTMSSPASLSAALADQAATGLALTEGLGLTRAETAALFAARFPLRAAPLCLERAPDPTAPWKKTCCAICCRAMRPSRREIGLAGGDPRAARDAATIISGRTSACSTAANSNRLLRAPFPRAARAATPTTCGGRNSSIAACANSTASACAPLPICSVCADFASLLRRRGRLEPLGDGGARRGGRERRRQVATLSRAADHCRFAISRDISKTSE